MKYALLTPDKNLFLINGHPQFSENLPVEKQRGYVEVNETVPFDHEIVGWQLVDGKCLPITRQQSPSYRERLAMQLKSKRQQEEATKQIEVGGVIFTKSMDTRVRLLEALAFSSPGDTVLFKDSSGEIRKISREDLQAIGLKFQQLSEIVSDTEMALAKELEAAAVERLPEIEQKIQEFNGSGK